MHKNVVLFNLYSSSILNAVVADRIIGKWYWYAVPFIAGFAHEM